MDPNVYSTITYEPSAFELPTPVCTLRTCDPSMCIEPIMADIDLPISLAELGRRDVFDGCVLYYAFHISLATGGGGFTITRLQGLRGCGCWRVVADL